MTTDIYFPKLKRRKIEDYYHSRNSFYASYRDNYVKIEEDCLGRCVYCDVTKLENGGDTFSIDHFRPKNVFERNFKIIAIHPYNLYLSCQKCNVLKSDDWYSSTDSIDGDTYLGKFGFIDRFHDDVNQFMAIDKGVILPLKDPAKFMIKKMRLNRPNRVYLRSRRELLVKKQTVDLLLNREMSKSLMEYSNGIITEKELAMKFSTFTYIQGQLASMII